MVVGHRALGARTKPNTQRLPTACLSEEKAPFLEKTEPQRMRAGQKNSSKHHNLQHQDTQLLPRLQPGSQRQTTFHARNTHCALTPAPEATLPPCPALPQKPCTHTNPAAFHTHTLCMHPDRKPAHPHTRLQHAGDSCAALLLARESRRTYTGTERKTNSTSRRRCQAMTAAAFSCQPPSAAAIVSAQCL